MNTLGITIAALGSAGPTGSGAILALGGSPADLVLGLGALVVATIGVLVVRHLNVSPTPSVPSESPSSHGDELKRAA